MRVLLVTHEASRTGAPRVAVLVARSLVQQGHSVSVLSRTPGPLLQDFAAVAPTSVDVLYRVRRKLWSWPVAWPIAWLVDTVLVLATLVRRRPDLVYVNSTAAAIYLRPARWLRRRALLHVHESGPLADQFLRAARAPGSWETITLIACSPSVQADLAVITSRSKADIAMLPSVPDDSEVVRLSQKPPDADYQPDELVVGCCGTVEHRKGADLWVEIARLVRQALPDRRVRFVWVGEIAEPVPGASELSFVHFVGPSPNPYAHMRRFDVSTLTSRDDPFPLVVLESMLLGTPVVAFAVGGVPQQIGDAGVLVPPADVETFAAAIAQLLADPERLRRLGGAAESRAKNLYSSDAFAARLAALINDT